MSPVFYRNNFFFFYALAKKESDPIPKKYCDIFFLNLGIYKNKFAPVKEIIIGENKIYSAAMADIIIGGGNVFPRKRF